MLRKVSKLIASALFLLAFFLFSPQKVEAQICSTTSLGGSTCTNSIQCRPAGEAACVTAVCEPAAFRSICKIPAAPGGGAPPVAPTITCPSGAQGMQTAVGCIPTENANEFARWFLGWGLGIGGGIAFLLILGAGFQIITSGGNPDRIKGGKEQLTAAISGLLFIIFSLFLLQLVGIDILHIPGF